MLKYYLTPFLLFAFLLTYGQTSIATYSFEASGDTWAPPTFSTPPCTLDDDTWNIHSQLGSIVPSQGDFFWGIQDLNGNCGASGFEHIEFQNVDIAQFRNVILSFDVQVLGYDNNDDIKYQLWFDDQAQPEVLVIDGGNDLSTAGWTQIHIDIPNSASSLRFKLSIRQNGSDIAGIDNILVAGDPLMACDEILISEYVEGSSSTSHRNNYIELYNASTSAIDLGSYGLIKYTGKNTNVSSTLSLSGSIPALGTFLIKDDQEALDVDADLSTNSAVMNYNGDDKIALIKNDEIIDLIGVIGDSAVFAKDITLRRQSHIQSPDDQFNPSEWDEYGLENITNLSQHSSYCEGQIPEIALESMGAPIKDGSNKTSFVNATYFGALPFKKDSALVRSYHIFNRGNGDLQIDDIVISGLNASDFKANFQAPETVVPGDSLVFSVTYKPSSLGLSTAKVQIINNDASENPYEFTIQGEGTGPVQHPLIISQYYEGEGNNKWIEITNIGQESTFDSMYYLALFWNDDTQNPIGIKPSRKKGIPALSPGQSIKYRATLNVNGPAYALDGQEVKTTVCSFTGDDILIISTTDDETCWENKTDIVGKTGNWGSDISLIRKYGCLQNGANTGFDLNDWLSFPYTEIDNASNGSNLRLGEYYSGPTSFENGSWQNGLPDLQREAVIMNDYDTGIDGSFEACNLHIPSGASLRISANTEILIQNDLIVTGDLEVMHEGSLLVVSDAGLTDNQGNISIHKSTRLLKPFDYTYWSSPVQHAELETVFEASPRDSFYIFSTANFEDQNQDGLDDNNDAWVRVLGAMEIARGYTSMAPNAPFTDQQHVAFRGKPNNGRITFPIKLQTNGTNLVTDWNLIGNPYPSALDAELLFNHPENQGLLNGTLYFWTHSTPLSKKNNDVVQSYSSDDYAMYTIGTGGIKANPNGQIPTQYIASCQGFFVEAISQGNLVFNNSMRASLNNDHFFKTAKQKILSDDIRSNDIRLWLNLYNDQGAFSQILLGFIEGAKKEYDRNYDGIRLRGNRYVSLYAGLEEMKFAILGMPPLNEEAMINLGFETYIEEDTELQLEIDRIEGDLEKKYIYLHDKLKNKVQDLKKGSYKFQITEQGDFRDRFELRIQNGPFRPDRQRTGKKRLIWFTENNFLFVKTDTNEVIKNIKIYDFNGRIIKDERPNKALVQIPWIGLPSRVMFLLRAKLENSRTLTCRIFP